MVRKGNGIMENLVTVRELYHNTEAYLGKEIHVGGWIRNLRTSKNFGFLILSDGTFFETLQVVYGDGLDNFSEIGKLNVGTAVIATGVLTATPQAKQPFEIQATEVKVEGASTPDYPLQPKRHTLEYLRTIQHLRPRTNTFQAVFRVRSLAAYAIHRFFQERGFVYVHTPLITASDAEGAGEMFQVTTMNLADVPMKEENGVKKPDFSQDFFKKPANLTVSGQLYGETFAQAFRNIYTFGPTFRAEDSNTTRHAAEFWMIEPEMAFADLEDDMACAEAMLKYVIRYVMENAPEEMAFLNRFVDKGLLERLNHGGVLPMFTSCSPGWVRYMEYEYPQLLPHLSTSKSPHMMFGAIVKSYWAKLHGIDPKDIFVVSIMPCIAKKSEIKRPECKTAAYTDVDAVLTTRECARLIHMFGIDFADLPDEEFDPDLLGDYTGAGVIFGASGGVMEAALRTVKQKLEGKKLEKVDFLECRGMQGVKEAEIEIAGQKMWIAITSSMTAAKPLLEEVKNGTSKYTFIEVMGCPGGCINGGGQSIVPSCIKNGKLGMGYKELRMKALYDEDVEMPLRVSSDNPQIQELYSKYLGQPGSEKAEQLLHTSYSRKEKFPKLDA